ncbi:MAG: chorismate mutase [Alphaproteobacteria bacterium]
MSEDALPSLKEIRDEIDQIDDQVHDLLMARAELVSSVARAKRGEGMQIVQPAREARLVRRLLGRHHGVLPRRTIIRIWRELISSVSMLQTGLKVVVTSDGDRGNARWDMAKNYFGSSLPMRSLGGVQNALSEVLDGRASFAVMPWPELDDETPWWASLFNRQGQNPLSIVCALPYSKTERLHNSDVYEKALIVARLSFMDSDCDNSFLGIELDAQVSRARILEYAKDSGLDLLNIYAAPVVHNNAAKVYLLLVQGCVKRDSQQLSDFAERFGQACYYCDVLGGYPVIPDNSN